MTMPMPQAQPRPNATAPIRRPDEIWSPTSANGSLGPIVVPEAFGWEIPDSVPVRRLIAAIGGLEKSGKTHLSLTAPPPVFYHDFDNGSEGVIEKFIAQGKKVYRHTYRMNANWQEMSEAEKKIEAAPLREEYQRFWDDSVRRGEGTVIVDTHSEEWEIRRLAAFGKLSQVMPHHYTEVNSQFRAEIREAYESGMNVILLQKMGKEYVGNNWTGKYEVKGYNDLPFLVQANIQAFRDPNDGQFKAFVKDCRQNMALAGQILQGPFCNFTMLLGLVFDS